MILGLAPMDGITNCAFRIVTRKLFEHFSVLGEQNPSSPDAYISPLSGGTQTDKLLLWTEFMNVDGYLCNPSKVIRHLMCTKSQEPLIAQIYGGDEEKLIRVAQDIQKKYAEYFSCIELNIGCPAPNVVKYGGGSSLMKDKERTLKMIKNLKSSLDMSFSIKTRTGINSSDIEQQSEFIIKASGYCDFITIHGRTYSQQHSGEVDWNTIYDIKKLVNPSCKIIGNGGIKSYEEISEKVGNLDGVMIGQSAIGNPWIFTSHKPSIQEIGETVIQHLNLSIACELYFDKYSKSEEVQNYKTYIFPMPTLENLDDYVEKIEELDNIGTTFFSVPEFRKYLFSYVKGIENSKEFKIRTCKIGKYSELVGEIRSFFSNPQSPCQGA